MKLSPVAPLFAAAAFGLSACGGDEESSSSNETTTGSSSSALTELAATREGLEAARMTYRGGDKAAAGEQVSEAYLQHFEHVEGALEAKDEELNEKLEDGIREELREDIKSAPKADVEKQFEAIFADMRKAEAALR